MGKKTTGKKGHEWEGSNSDDSNTKEEVINSQIRLELSDNDFEIGGTDSGVVAKGDVDVKNKKKRRDEIRYYDVDFKGNENEGGMGNDFDGNGKRNEVGSNDDGLSSSRIETIVNSNVGEGTRKKEKEKKRKKRQEVSGNDFEFDDVENVEGKKKKRKTKIGENENDIQKAMKKYKKINDDWEVSEVNDDSKQNQLGLEEHASLQKNDQEDSENNSELEMTKRSKKMKKERVNKDSSGHVSSVNDVADDNIKGNMVKHLSEEWDITERMNGKESGQKKKKKQRKSDNGGVDGILINNETDGEARKERELFDGNKMEKVDNGRKEKKKKKRDQHNDTQDEKVRNENSGVEVLKGHAILEECGKKDKKKKSKSVKGGSDPYHDVKRKRDRRKENVNNKMKTKKVSFSHHVEVFPSSDVKSVKDDGLVRGKRFTKEEDEMIKKAVMNYIETRGLGKEGLDMVLNCRSHPEVKHCWKEVTAALPWRPYESVYCRAHVIFLRSEDRKWTPEELEKVRKFHEKHGPSWKMLADELGKHRRHVGAAWGRIKLPNQKRGHWSQEEYKKLFDLVNMDLRMRAFEEKKSKHGMLRDNISWEAISDKLATRQNALCCMKWYNQLTSPMVAEGKWADTDDYRLVHALSSLDACCMDDLDWDNLLEHRSGVICQKRWKQMVKHMGADGYKSFPGQVEILSTRYSPDVLEAREIYISKTPVDL